MARIITMVAIGLMLAGVTARASADQASPVVPPPAATDDQARVVGSSRSVAGFKTDRGGARRRDGGLLVDFVPAESGEPAGTGHKSKLDAAQKHTVLCCDFWIFDAWVELFDDVDRDGYHTYFRVGFDVDTGHADADVYVKLFLRGANGVWNLFYESGVFPIFGTAGGDDYEVETELVAGYPRDDYDILIEVYDAYYDELVVEYGPAETSALSYVPLEDLASDGLVTPPVAISSGGGGGALSIELLILLLAFTAMSMRRPRAAG